MANNEEFIQQRAEQFIEELKKIDLTKDDAKKLLGSQILSYDKTFVDRYSCKTPQQMANDYKQTKSYIPVPEEGSEIEKYMKHTFIADGSVFGHYQHLMRQAQVPEYFPPPPPPPSKDPDGPEELSKNFIRPPFNYQDNHVNSKALQNTNDQFQNRYLNTSGVPTKFQGDNSPQTPQQLESGYRNHSSLEKFNKHSFIADGSSLSHQKHLTRSALVPEYSPMHPTPPPIDLTGPEELQKQFIRSPYNYQDSNINTRTHQRNNEHYPLANQQRPLIDNNSQQFYKYQLEILQMQQQQQNVDKPVEDPAKEQKEKLKFNINKLGGMEDTIGVMQQSLHEFEFKNMVPHKSIFSKQ